MHLRCFLGPLVLLALHGCTASPRPDLASRSSGVVGDGLALLANQNNLYFGTSVQNAELGRADFTSALGPGFNLITPEYEMQMNLLWPTHGPGGSFAQEASFGPAESIVQYAAAHGLKVHGTSLLWHAALPPWLASRPSDPAYAPELEDIARDYVQGVVGYFKARYPGVIVSWDVLNETMSHAVPGASDFSIWNSINSCANPRNVPCSSTRLYELAFQWANAADPQALLFYNDFGREGMNPSSDLQFEILGALKARGIPIHGVGLQTHDNLQRPLASGPEMASNVARLGAQGLKTRISEMDYVIPVTSDGQGSATDLEAQASRFAEVLDVCLRAHDCVGFTVWNLSDRDSWLVGGSYGQPGTGAPTLLDASYQPKPAFTAVRTELLALPNPDRPSLAGAPLPPAPTPPSGPTPAYSFDPGPAGLNGVFDVPLPFNLLSASVMETVEVWFRTSIGGLFLGYQNQPPDLAPSAYVPLLGVDAFGRLSGQFWHGAADPMLSTTNVTDGRWHQAVLVAASQEQALYLDGQWLAHRFGPLNHLNMYFSQLGTGAAVGWPGWTTDARGWSSFNGSIGLLHYFSGPLSPDQVKMECHASMGRFPGAACVP